MKSAKYIILVMLVAISVGCGREKKDDKTAQGLTGENCSGNLTICGYQVQSAPVVHAISTPLIGAVRYIVSNCVAAGCVEHFVVSCSTSQNCTFEGTTEDLPVQISGAVRKIQFTDPFALGSIGNSTYKVKAQKDGNMGTELNGLPVNQL